MKQELKALILYRLERAHESLAEAHILNCQKGDYADFVRFNINEVSPWYDEAKGFVEYMEEIIKKEIGKTGD